MQNIRHQVEYAKPVRGDYFPVHLLFIPGWIVRFLKGPQQSYFRIVIILSLQKSTIMKLFLALIIAIVLTSCAKERAASTNSSSSVEDRNATPPQAVATSFIAGFGNVVVSQWKLRNDGTYTAHFTNNGVLWEATYKADGSLVKSEPA